ncbi:MAG: hypothetical protein WCO00_03140 [Rhodospirillaceae bacterium]
MTDLCKHKGAASSINWFVGFLKGKSGSDRRDTMAALSAMLHDMKTKNCSHCPARTDCRELDDAVKAISERENLPKIVADTSIVGPLMMKRESARRNRLARPFGR